MDINPFFFLTNFQTRLHISKVNLRDTLLNNSEEEEKMKSDRNINRKKKKKGKIQTVELMSTHTLLHSTWRWRTNEAVTITWPPTLTG